MAENTKRTYEKMTIEKVSLIPEEAVLGGYCNTSTSSGEFAMCEGASPCNILE